MSRGRYPLLRASGAHWTPTSPVIDHPLRGIPHRIQAIGRRLLAGDKLTVNEERTLAAWREVQGSSMEKLWPDNHATPKRKWFEVQ